MKDIKAVRGANILRRMIAEGEHENQDFKFAISDARKIARSLSAFANNSGGRLLIGVKDNGTIAGVRNEEDIYVVEQAAERYCRPAQTVDFHAYQVEGKHVIVAEIARAESRPVYVLEKDSEPRAYYRVADENIAAHPLMVRSWDMRESADRRGISLDGPYTRVLDLLGARGRIADAREAAVALHISVADAEEAIALLASYDLLSFAFDGTKFYITMPR